MTPEQELRNLAAKVTSPGSPLMDADIQKLNVDSELVSALENCFSSDRQEDLSLAFLFLGALLEKNKPSIFPVTFYEKLVPRVRALIQDKHSYVRYRALELFVWLRKNYSDYRTVMMENLVASDLGAKRIALANYETYANPGEVFPLVRFSTDSYAADYSMNSTQFYELRDSALQKVSDIVGINFCNERLTQPHEGTTVSWFDWGPFLEWWEINKRSYS
ncbi:hypothetical protein H9L17_14250 [Thermomonas brevis]|uniref:HEAT repeat domain-containing protein n=1 Tax=Thermomonas brevis TaxID=215691 RepID=A0A7G9QSI6_9GAMM|nr:hypothetical protein [Thermomonas brevis]QNN46311.1 hypothetical protein H9L17_14250 [Thermomonas brevis]